jgi:NAD-dependent dihydropyrimidine dehydrogenase PreA subunit
MKIQAIFLICLLFQSLAAPIEIQLYKSSLAYEELKKTTAMIDDIDRTQFLADLKLGSKSLPLQVEMSKEDVFVLNEKPNEDNAPIHNEEKSKTEKASIGDKNFDLEYKLTDNILDEPLNKDSNGILGLSLGDLENKNDKKFVDQLVKNKVAGNKSFYFEFDDVKTQQCKVPTLEDYLGIKGKIVIGDYPYNISPQKYSKDKVKTTQVLQIIKNKEIPMHDDSSLAIQFNMEKCIGCTSCVKACSNIAGQDIIECEKKGKAHTASGKLLSDTDCISC